MVDFGMSYMITKGHEQTILSAAITSRDTQLVFDHAKPEIIIAKHIELAKEALNEMKGRPPLSASAEREIYENLLANADTKVLQVVLDRAEKSSKPIDGLAHDIYNEIEQRKLSDAIKSDNPELLRTFVNPSKINPIINDKHIILSAEKYEQEIIANGVESKQTSNDAAHIFKALVKSSKTSLLDGLSDDSSQINPHLKELIKREVTARQNRRQNMVEKVVHGYTSGFSR